MQGQNLIPVSDYFELAVLNLLGISPVKTTHTNRFFAFFDSEKAERILTEYQSGNLQVSARDYASAIQRMKSKIFESERASKLGAKNHAYNRPAA